MLREALPDTGGVTAQRGATGTVADDGTVAGDGYVVRLADGRHVPAARDQLSLRSHHQADLALPDHDRDPASLVTEHTILATVVGSRSFGLDTDGSDTDTRGVRTPAMCCPSSRSWRAASGSGARPAGNT